jgi:sugar phosphate isomerase/epimerase
MRIGSRITKPEEVWKWDMEIAQISVYRGNRNNIERVEECSVECRKRGLPYVVHPVGYGVLDEKVLSELFLFADLSEEALILHDEKGSDGRRIAGPEAKHFSEVISELSARTHISFENAVDNLDIIWFWHFAPGSITLDIGHIEAAGLDSVEFIRNLDGKLVEEIRYVHIHRKGVFRNGLTDHWFLTPACRELVALEEVVGRKRDIAIILEINEVEMISKNLVLLKNTRDKSISEM